MLCVIQMLCAYWEDVSYKQWIIKSASSTHLDGIKHKWANPHFDEFEKKSCFNMKYMIKRINTN